LYQSILDHEAVVVVISFKCRENGYADMGDHHRRVICSSIRILITMLLPFRAWLDDDDDDDDAMASNILLHINYQQKNDSSSIAASAISFLYTPITIPTDKKPTIIATFPENAHNDADDAPVGRRSHAKHQRQ
jgi:hypothetical protein